MAEPLVEQAINKGAGIVGERLAQAGARKLRGASKATWAVLMLVALATYAAYAYWDRR